MTPSLGSELRHIGDVSELAFHHLRVNFFLGRLLEAQWRVYMTQNSNKQGLCVGAMGKQNTSPMEQVLWLEGPYMKSKDLMEMVIRERISCCTFVKLRDCKAILQVIKPSQEIMQSNDVKVINLLEQAKCYTMKNYGANQIRD